MGPRTNFLVPVIHPDLLTEYNLRCCYLAKLLVITGHAVRGMYRVTYLIPLLFAVQVSAQSWGDVRGSIVEADTGLPLPGVSIPCERNQFWNSLGRIGQVYSTASGWPIRNSILLRGFCNSH